jgi:ApaG protein
MYSAETMGIQVVAQPNYAPERSDPERGVYFWSYTITIRNLGPVPVQLRARYWRITDALGRVQEVEGAGVVGEEPSLAPGESFEYTSGCPLTTPSGFMTGHYRMQTPEGDFFDAEIPAFSLDLPDVRRVVN